ncbi:N-acetyltransferase [Patescibacteria group bacterium]|nr:MAG: N-acetyltransferase [Patescibacteria group bacterium]
MEINYSRANRRDKQDVYELSLLLNKGDDTKTTKDIEESVNRALKNNLVWSAKDEDRIIGYVLCELFDETQLNFPNSIFISELYVVDAFRKQGVGKELVKMVLSNKFPKKYYYFSVTHDPKAFYLTDFYKSCGFEEKGITNAGNIKLTRKI